MKTDYTSESGLKSNGKNGIICISTAIIFDENQLKTADINIY